jgi:hypothetical protein
MNDYQNFETFVKDLQRFKKTSAYSWCKERQNIIQDNLNKKKIVLTEINQYDSQVLPPLHRTLFQSFLMNIRTNCIIRRYLSQNSKKSSKIL